MDKELMDVKINGKIEQRAVHQLVRLSYFKGPAMYVKEPVLNKGEEAIWHMGSAIPTIIKVK